MPFVGIKMPVAAAVAVSVSKAEQPVRNDLLTYLLTYLIDDGLRVIMVHCPKVGLDSPAPFISRCVALPSRIQSSVIY